MANNTLVGEIKETAQRLISWLTSVCQKLKSQLLDKHVSSVRCAFTSRNLYVCCYLEKMPHVSSTGAEDLASTDEVKVYHDEGEQEEQRTSEDISEVKLGLVTETEQVMIPTLLLHA